MKACDKHFLCGFGLAVAEIVRLHDEPGIARDVLDGSGFGIEDFVKAGLEEYDLAEIRKALA